MFRVAIFQATVATVIATCLWVWADARSAITAMLGGAACAVPNAMLAANLAALARWQNMQGDQNDTAANARKSRNVALVMLIAEFFKVALTIALLVLAVLAYKKVVWLVLVPTLCACLFVQPFALNRQTRLQ